MPTTNPPGFSERIAAEVGSWPGVEVDRGEIGELAFKIGPRELGHLHGDHAAHLFFAPDEWRELAAQDRVTHHPVFPTKAGPAAREIRDDSDVDDVITLFRMRYDRVVARHGVPSAPAG